jgi:hypothetical protein
MNIELLTPEIFWLIFIFSILLVGLIAYILYDICNATKAGFIIKDQELIQDILEKIDRRKNNDSG